MSFWAIILINDQCWSVKSTVGGITLEQMLLSCVRKNDYREKADKQCSFMISA